VNADGYDDVLIGDSEYGGTWGSEAYEGRALLYLGNASGAEVDPAWIVEGNLYYAFFGQAVAYAGDVNADGFDDVLVSCGCQVAGSGRASIYLGWSGGLSNEPAWDVSNDQALSSFGVSLATAGDVNGDGWRDVIVGASTYSHGEHHEGRAFVYTSMELGCGQIGIPYCLVNPNSTGLSAQMEAWCSARASDGSLRLEVGAVPNQFGVFFHGAAQQETPFGNGYMCVTDDLVRGAVIHASNLVASYRYDNSDAKHSLVAFIGSTRNFQYWFRDPAAGGALFNTSNAVSITIVP
jgi:hypothetical protein